MPTVKVHFIESVSVTFLKTKPPILRVAAKAQNLNNNYKNIRLEPLINKKPPTDGIYELSMIGDTPEFTDTIHTEVNATYDWKKYPVDIKGIKVYSTTNSEIAMIQNDDLQAAETGEKDEWTGISNNYSFEEALKDALSKVPKDLPRDYFKYTIKEMAYEQGGFLLVNNLLVTIKLLDIQ